MARARNLLFRPGSEWAAINGEFTNAAAIYKSYIFPVSAIGPIASILGGIVFGQQGSLFGTAQTSIRAVVQDGVAHYVLGLAAVYVLAMALEFLAPPFSGQPNRVQALKAAAYASTPAWLFGALALIPRLAPFALLGWLWTLALLYSAAPLLLKVQRSDKAATYGVVAAVVAVMVALVFEALARALG